MTVTTYTIELEQTVKTLCERVSTLQKEWPLSTGRRILIALAGVPGSGKSTISSTLLATLKRQKVAGVEVVPMDGFHLPKSVLAASADPEEAFRRRGAPFTFDADAFVKTVIALKNTRVTAEDDPSLAILLPSFDHAKQDPIADDIYISSSSRVLIMEGNYLLLDESPWNVIPELVDEAWFVDVPNAVARQRLIKRHMEAGIENTIEAAAARAESNDLRNGELIRSKLSKPDVVIQN